jgi:hypothetical protein
MLHRWLLLGQWHLSDLSHLQDPLDRERLKRHLLDRLDQWHLLLRQFQRDQPVR